MAITALNTFKAFTDRQRKEEVIDNVFVGSPGLAYLKKGMKPAEGTAYEIPVQLAFAAGEWYTRGGQLSAATTITPESSDIATYSHVYSRRKVLLEGQDVDLQGREAIVNMMEFQIGAAYKALGDLVATSLFSTVSNALTGLNVLADNVTATVGGLNGATSGWTSWCAHVMEGTGTYAVAVSPSLANLWYAKRTVEESCGDGEEVDVCFVAPAYWNILAADASRQDGIVAGGGAGKSVKWGFPSIDLLGMEIMADRKISNSAWVAGQSTRANAAGYQAYLVNSKRTYLIYAPSRSFKWQKHGWTVPDDYDRYANIIYFWGQVACESRRSMCRLFNVNIAEAMTGWGLGTVTIPVQS